MRVPNFVDVSFFGMDRGVVGVHLIRLKVEVRWYLFEMFLEHSVHFLDRAWGDFSPGGWLD